MNANRTKIIAGFIVLFCLYHAAEYMIVYRNSPAGFLAFQAFFFIAAHFIGRWQTGRGLASWGLDFNKGVSFHLSIGLMMGIILYTACFFLALALRIERIAEVPDFLTIMQPLALFIFGNFFSSLSEDVLTRGYVFRHLNGRLSLPIIAFISALIYLLNHIYRLSDGPTAWIYLFALGLIYVVPLLITRRLWLTGGMHWAGNCVFFYTHEIVKTVPGDSQLSFNYLLVAVILVLLPASYWVARIVMRRTQHIQF